MNNSAEIKETVRKKYGEIALAGLKVNNTSCGCGGGVSFDYSVMADEYTNIEGYHADADLGLGCGLPTEFANIKKGDTVIDLGSGAGNDVFVARRLTGEDGKLIGLDFTDEMLAKANENKLKLGYENVDFVKGEIEEMPFDDNIADVIISNCVLNLVPDKQKAFAEIHRVMKPGASFCVSDIVLTGELPAKIRNAAEMYAGCVAGALMRDEYISVIQNQGFDNIKIVKEKAITLPEETLKMFVSDEETKEYQQKETPIYSITVYAEKPQL